MSSPLVFRYPSSDGKNDLYGRIDLPECFPPKGILQVVHGMIDHIDRYEDFMKLAAAAGYIVCGHDHLGHGKTALPGDLGYIADENGWQFLLEDTVAFGKEIRSRYPGLPHFLIGHSMGSLVSRLVALRDDFPLDGLILCGTVGPHPGAPAALSVCRRISRRKGKRYVSSFLMKYAAGGNSFEWTNRDPEMLRLKKESPLENFMFTSSGIEDLLHLEIEANRDSSIRKLPKALPVYLISGTEDPVGDYGKGVRKVTEKMKKAGLKDVTLKLYKGYRHELLQELDRETVFQDVLDWMEKELLCLKTNRSN